MSTDPLHGDLGLRLTLRHAAPPRSAPPGPSAAQPASPAVATTAPGHARTRTLTRKISFPSSDLDPATLARLQRAVVAFAVVEFDIDAGPVALDTPGFGGQCTGLTYTHVEQNLDNTFPRTRFARAVEHNIAFSSLPDGADLARPDPQGAPADPSENGYAYSWRIPYRRDDGDVGDDGDGSLYGHVWFVRERVRYPPLPLWLAAPARALMLSTRALARVGLSTPPGLRSTFPRPREAAPSLRPLLLA